MRDIKQLADQVRQIRKFAWSDQVQQAKAGPLSLLLSALFAFFAVK